MNKKWAGNYTFMCKYFVFFTNIGIKHGFSCINILQVPREVLKTEAEAVLTSTHNLYFGQEIRKIMYIHVNLSFTT